MKNLIYLLFSFFLSVTAHDFSLCSDDPIFKITQVNLTPDPPLQGNNLEIDITGDVTNTITTFETDMTLKLYSVQIISENFDLCSFTSCPITGSPSTVKFVYEIPNIFPTGVAFDLQFNSSNIACLDISITFEKETVTQIQ
jgi:hypothetical protein